MSMIYPPPQGKRLKVKTKHLMANINTILKIISLVIGKGSSIQDKAKSQREFKKTMMIGCLGITSMTE